VFLAFAAFVAFFYNAILDSESLATGQILSHVSSLRQLQLAIHSYSTDARALGRPEIYPESLQDLVKEDVLAQTDLDRLSRLAKITYIRPQASDVKETLVLTSMFRKKCFLVPLEGKVMIHSAE
jgi:hypothetical protein